MIIPEFIVENFSLKEIANDAFCPANMMNALEKRAVSASSVKSKWNTCMGKKWCKIVAIIVIIIVGLLVLWIISILINILCCGVSCARSFCNCCNCCHPRQRPPPPPPQQKDSRGDAYNNPNMYYHPQNNNGYNQQQRYYYN